MNMKIDVDSLTDAEVAEIQDHQWDDSEYRASSEPWKVAMKELCENMRSLSISEYRQYMKNCEENWAVHCD